MVPNSPITLVFRTRGPAQTQQDRPESSLQGFSLGSGSGHLPLLLPSLAPQPGSLPAQGCSHSAQLPVRNSGNVLAPNPPIPSSGTAQGHEGLIPPQVMGLLMQHLGTCSSQTPKFPAVQPQAPGLLHAQMSMVVTTDRAWSPARAAPAQAAFHARVVQATGASTALERGSGCCQQLPHSWVLGEP